MTHDPINRPSHYAEGRQYEPINVIEDWQLSYRLGNVVKYVSRAGRKDPAKTVEDLKKAQWYLNREIEALEASTVPYGVAYEDVLEDYAACAAEGYEYNAGLSLDQHDLWDDTIGPVEPYQPVPRRQINKNKENEILRTFERRGVIFGIDKNGNTYMIGSADLVDKK